MGPSNTATALEKIKAEINDVTIDMTPDDEAALQKALARPRSRRCSRIETWDNDLIRKLAITNLRYAGRQQSLKYYVGFSQKVADKQPGRRVQRDVPVPPPAGRHP